MNILLIGLGGACGAITRYLLTMALSPLGQSFPKGTLIWGTLLVNALGCFLAGIAMSLKMKHPEMNPLWLNGIMFGFLGALTTFSTFTSDNFKLFAENQNGLLFTNIAMNLVTCFSLLAVGYYFTNYLIQKS